MPTKRKQLLWKYRVVKSWGDGPQLNQIIITSSDRGDKILELVYTKSNEIIGGYKAIRGRSPRIVIK